MDRSLSNQSDHTCSECMLSDVSNRKDIEVGLDNCPITDNFVGDGSQNECKNRQSTPLFEKVGSILDHIANPYYKNDTYIRERTVSELVLQHSDIDRLSEIETKNSNDDNNNLDTAKRKNTFDADSITNFKNRSEFVSWSLPNYKDQMRYHRIRENTRVRDENAGAESYGLSENTDNISSLHDNPSNATRVDNCTNNSIDNSNISKIGPINPVVINYILNNSHRTDPVFPNNNTSSNHNTTTDSYAVRTNNLPLDSEPGSTDQIPVQITTSQYGEHGISSILDSTFVVEAVPVKSMILVTAKVVDNTSHTDSDSTEFLDNESNIEEKDEKFENIRTMGRRRICFILSFVLITITVVIVYFYNGFCYNGVCIQKVSDSSKIANVPTSTPTISYQPSVVGKSFRSRMELETAVDHFIYGDDPEELFSTYGMIANWDVSFIKNFSSLFAIDRVPTGYTFNENLSRWNVSSATTMSNMFDGAERFTSDLSRWDVSKVTDFSYMFAGAKAFKSDISRWDVSSAHTMDKMFAETSSFTSDLSKWYVGKVTSMMDMFNSATMFNSDLSQWDVGRVTSMFSIFFQAANFTSDLSKWNVSRVQDLSAFAYKASNFNGNLSRWDISKVTSTSYAFSFTESFTGKGIDTWDTRNVEVMDNMFNGAVSFDADLSNWNLRSVTSSSYMFSQTRSFKGVGLEKWNVSILTAAVSMFQRANAFDANLSQWDVSNIQDMTNMFAQTNSFQGYGLDTWNFNSSSDHMLCDAKALKRSYIAYWNIPPNSFLC